MTSDELILGVREALMGANTNVLGTDDAALLRHLNKALVGKIIPLILKVREEYYGISTRTTIQPSISRYRVPTRAMYNKLRSLLLFSTVNGYEVIVEVDPPLRRNYSGGDWSKFRKAYFEGNDVVLVPPVAATTSPGSLEFSFYFRPGDLVLTASARQVTGVNTGTKVISIATPLSTFSAGVLLDVHSPASGAEIKIWDNAIASLNMAQTDLTMTDPIDGSIFGTKVVAIGDWVCLAGQAAVAGIPKEFDPLLVDAAAVRILQSMADPALKPQAQLLDQQAAAVQEVIEGREESRPLRLRGRGGTLRAGRL